MKMLHDLFSRTIPAYYRWHKHPLAGTTHWALFVAISCAFATNLLFAINSYAQTVDETASTTEEIIVDSADASASTTDFIAQTQIDDTGTTTTEVIVPVAVSDATSTDIASTSDSVATTSDQVTQGSGSSAQGPEPISVSSISSDINIANTEATSVPVTQVSDLAITRFSVPAIVMNTLVVPIEHFEISDQSLVSGYMVNASSVAPSVDDFRWTTSAPSSITFPKGARK